jgi:hypothetical protein
MPSWLVRLPNEPTIPTIARLVGAVAKRRTVGRHKLKQNID